MEDRIDAFSLLHEFVKVHLLIKDQQDSDNQLPWDAKIRLKRIYATLMAYLHPEIGEGDQKATEEFLYTEDRKKFKYVFEFFKFDTIKLPPLKEEDITEALSLLVNIIKNPTDYKTLVECSEEWAQPMNRLMPLSQLMQVRLKSAELRDLFSGVLGGKIFMLPILTVDDLYFKHLVQSDQKLEELIVCILGSSFKGSYTKEFLVKYYGYPKTTDRSLLDYYWDNF